MEKPPRLLLSRLWLQNRVYDVTLNSIVFAWKETEPNRKRAPGTNWNTCKAAGSHSVPVCEVIAVQETAEENQKSKKNVGKWHRVPRSPEESYQPPAFTVFYVERTRQHRWRCRSVTFHCPDWGLCQQWIQTIEEQLTLLTYRPKRLLVYINPFGGKQQGKRIYEQKVAPIFSRASISTDVIVTERANHARDHLKSEADLKKYDGVVCVGGDGMFSEIVHGLVWRTQSDSGVDQNCPEETLVPCDIRIGIIPAGSTDCICYATVGANDPVTSALHIIVGDSQPIDVCSVHHHNTFLRYSISLLGYGFYGDLLTDSEKKRWMGPTRYDFSGVKTFLSHHYYEGTVSFLPAIDNASSPRDKFKCRSGCHVCQHSDHLPLEEEEEEEEQDGVVESGHKDVWRVIRGKFVAINAVSMSCACPRSPKGLSPAAHLSDGTTDLILVHKCSRLDFLRHLLRHTNKNDQFDHSFVEVHRVRRFRFMPKHQEADPEELDLCERGGEGEGGGGGGGRGRGRRLFGQICRDHPACSTCAPTHSTWSCDGETLPHTAIQVGVHCQLIKLFARGIEEQPVFEESSAVCSA